MTASSANLVRTRGLVLPPQGTLPLVEDDPLPYYYRPLTAPLYVGRLRMARRLLGARVGSVLDVGFGSGIFLPELARTFDRVVGVEVHDRVADVAAAMSRLGLDLELREASLYELPFADGEFDALVCLSVLEHLTDLDGAFAKLRRVVRRGGALVAGFPVRNVLTNSFFRLVGYDPLAIHPSSHSDILAAARRAPGLRVEERARMPRVLPEALGAYAAFRCDVL